MIGKLRTVKAILVHPVMYVCLSLLDNTYRLKGHNMQHSGHMGQNFAISLYQVGATMGKAIQPVYSDRDLGPFCDNS